MRLVSYTHAGTSSWGVIGGNSKIVRGTEIAGGKWPSLRALLASGEFGKLASLIEGLDADLPLSDVQLLPVVPDPAHIYCAGLNYLAHAQEVQKDTPSAPRFFLRAASSMIGAGVPVRRPKVSHELDFEGELAVILGKGGRHISEADAMSHVAGYTCFMDGSIRDYQQHTTTSGKNFKDTGALGPWMVTADEIPDWQDLTLETRLNGETMQKARTDKMMVSIPQMLAYLSQISELQPGDIVATGTPEGIGYRREPRLFMKSGDTIEVTISGIGTLTNPVADE